MDATGGPMRAREIPYVEPPPVVKLREWLAQHPDSLVIVGDAPADE